MTGDAGTTSAQAPQGETTQLAAEARQQLRRVLLRMFLVIVLVAIAALGGAYQLALVVAVIIAFAALIGAIKLRRIGRQMDALAAAATAAQQTSSPAQDPV